MSNDSSKKSKTHIMPSIILSILAYYLVLLGIAIASLVILIIKENKVEPPLLARLGLLASGAIVGSVLYQNRMLYRHYIKYKDFEIAWLGKYISAPWEAVALALSVVALIQGSGGVLGGNGFKVLEGNSFAAFGVGSLIGFGIREVVGWLGSLAKAMFPTEPAKEAEILKIPPEPSKHVESL